MISITKVFYSIFESSTLKLYCLKALDLILYWQQGEWRNHERWTKKIALCLMEGEWKSDMMSKNTSVDT